MANLRTAMDSAFWDQPISSPQTLDAAAHSIPGHPFPLDATRASRALRIQQLSLLSNGFPFGIIPSYSPSFSSHKQQLGSFSLQSVLLKLASSNGWLGLVGQCRPKKLISSIKSEFSNAEEIDFSVFKDAAKHILDKSLYAIGLSGEFSPTPSSSVLLSTERHGDKKKPRQKLMFYHQLPNHDITLEAAWPELFIDHKGAYWDVPESISLDMASLVHDSGFRYRVGIHKNSGDPTPVTPSGDEPPSALMPGICAKAAFSYEKAKDFWRKKRSSNEADKGLASRSYDLRLNQPHSAISGIIGGSCAAWFGGKGSSISEEGEISANALKRSPLQADLFGSVCYTYQYGEFKKAYGDLSRVDARLDICSALAFTKRAFNVFSSSANSEKDLLSSPRLSLILQQQVAGPIAVRVDSRFSLGSSSTQKGPHLEDVVYTLSYSLKLLKSGKVAARYSPRRKEGMIELRLFEF